MRECSSRVLQSSLFHLASYILLGASSVLAQEIGLTASSERKTLRLGEPVTVTVTARVPAMIDTIGPVLADSAGLFEILAISKDDEENRWSFELMTIDTGTVFLPPLAFAYTLRGDSTGKTAYSNALSFSVAGVAISEGADIRDIRPPMAAPWKWEDIWPFLLVALFVFGAWYAYRRYRAAHPLALEDAEPLPIVAPHVRALKELRLLEEKQLWQQGKVKEYYSEATEIVRRFFEGRWDLPALEMTSDEILRALRAHTEAGAFGEALNTFFVRADMVKFAKAQPTPDDHRVEMDEAFAIVRAMTPAEQVPAESESNREASNVR